jgi:hypothetical protein
VELKDLHSPLPQIPPDSACLKAKVENAAYPALGAGEAPLKTQDYCPFYSDESDSILTVLQLETSHSYNPELS